MNCKFFPALLVVLTCLAEPARAAEPFRVFLRGGPKTHGPAGNGLHEHERWLADWKRLLAERGAQVQGAMRFPTAEELAETDVLVMFAAEAGSIGGTDRDNLDKFLKRGGGIVCLHDAVCGTNAHWFKTVIGGAWEHGHSKWYEGDISFYYVNREHPITEGASNFDLDDEVYWDLHLLPEAKVLAASWQPDARNMRGGRPSPHIYNVIPQMWTYEKRHEGGKTHRAFVAIPGHKYSTFDLPHMRAVLLRGIAWAGDRHINELCSPEELASLRYPARGPTAPEKAAASLVVHPEFNLSLVAAEPLVTKPIAMDWDPAGRLWVAETPEYPNGRRGIRGDQTNDVWKDHGGLVAAPGPQQRPARDRISILTDLDGDGRMEKKQVFFEGLELVTGFVFHKDGVIVAQAPDILWLRDVNGDGKAERVEVLYTGLGTFDTHAVINNLRWGFDGWIYATHGYSGTEHVYNGDKSKDFGRIGSGVVRFKPDGSAFEQYSSKGGNTWGLDIAWDNEVFFTQPTSDDLLNHVVLPESVLARGKSGNATSFKPVIRSRPSKPLIKSENLAYVQIDLVGRFTAAAGCAIYDGGTWPTAWNYSYFTTEPTINLVHHEVVQRAGVTYTADKTRDEEFVAGRDLWFRPIETRIGPDGALYVLDFYNQAVIHNDTRGPKHNNVNAAVRPDRDHFFGRIWRLDHQQARKQPVPDLSSAAVKELLDAYEHPNRHVRMNAHRLITELAVPARRQQASAALRALVSNAAKPAYARVLALWTLELLGAITPEEAPLVAAAATDADPAVSRNALKVAARHGAGKPVVDDATLLKALKSPHAQVRLQALLAAGTAASPEVFQAAVDLYPDLDDAWSRSALLATADSKPWEFLQAAFKSSRGRELQSLVGSLTRVAVSRSGVSASSVADLAVQIVSLAAEADAAADPLKVATLTALAENLSRDVPAPKPAELDGAFRRLLTSSNPEVAGAALPLLASWDRGGALAPLAQPVIARLLERLRDAGLSDEQRGQAAASALRARGLDTGVLPAISALLGSGDSADLQRRIITALGATGDAAAGAALVDAYANLSPELQLAAFGQIVTRADWSLALLDALKAGRVSLGLLGPGNIHRLRT
ncbi:MAG TPA: PVC-type heme-binding CxxCH protein, partial [Methylomirabilota bacterium]|nr:PVC-type heme-binding CxxCH protein [Methylomirabilota bacterium]